MRLIINDCGGAAFAVTVSMPNNAQLCNIVNGRIRQARICQNIGLGGGGQTCTITTVQKDNLVLEIYNYGEGRNYL